MESKVFTLPLRIDDFPHGSRELYQTKPHAYWLDVLGEALEVFESKRIPYILGASPGLFQKGDVGWLNTHVHYGRVVMHGFDHLWSWKHLWNDIGNSWPHGGEFAEMDKGDFRDRYEKASKVLKEVRAYDPSWFVSPFNTYTQSVLDALQDTPVQRICGVDTLYKEFSYCKMDYGKLEVVNSEYNVSYAFASRVLEMFPQIKSQITLHWIFDQNMRNWVQSYRELAQLLKSREKNNA